MSKNFAALDESGEGSVIPAQKVEVLPEPMVHETEGLGDSIAGNLVKPKDPKDLFDLTPEDGKVYNPVAAKRRFLGAVKTHHGTDLKQLDQDPEFDKDFTDLLSLEIDLKKRNGNIPEYLRLKRKVQDRILTLGADRQKALPEKSYRAFTKLERGRNLAIMVNSKYAQIVDPQKQAAFGLWQKNRQLLNQRLNAGEISFDEYLAQNDREDGEVVKASGDGELQEVLAMYQNEEKGVYDDLLKTEEAKIAAALHSGDQPILDAAVVKQSFASVSDSGMAIEFVGGNAATVVINDDKNLPISVRVFKDLDSGEVVFCLIDEYTKEAIRVKRGQLLDALDYRHVDGYLSRQVNLHLSSDNQQSAADVPDEDVVRLGQRLIGDAGSRGYGFTGEDKQLLDGLVETLVVDEGDFGLYKKVEALNLFFEDKGNVDLVRREILDGKKLTVKQLIG